MSPVGGSRHYQGGGLGQVGMWACPSCGEDNTGKIEQGCVHCGAGVPRAAAPPTPTPPVPAPDTQMPRDQPDEFEAWIARHPEATLKQAFIAGYIEGHRASTRDWLARHPPPQEPAAMPTAAAADPTIDPRTYRTVVAALALFRDQVLVERPEEIAAGEWLSAEEATTVITQLQQLLGSEREVTRV